MKQVLARKIDRYGEAICFVIAKLTLPWNDDMKE